MENEFAARVHTRLQVLGDPGRARAMAAYMRTTDPFYGVGTPERRALLQELARGHAPQDRSRCESQILELWGLNGREGRYLALDWACRFKDFIRLEALPLYERLIREGAWWDTVDVVGPKLVGRLLRLHPEVIGPVLEAWIQDPCLWMRRAALLSQLTLKGATDASRLFDHCLRLAPEKDFFIRKAIGWALREYGKTNPQAVARFLETHRPRLSALSYREGHRRLGGSP